MSESDFSSDSSATDGASDSDAGPQSGSTWYAACDSGHASWLGPNRPSYDAAQDDAHGHDASRHGGSETAAVVGGA